MYKLFIKQIIDFLVSLVAVVILTPLLLIITIGLFFANNGKPFFFQLRPGKNGKIFKIIKFKTMNEAKDAQGNLLSDAERLTPIGKFVRKTSLDEIPQLLNVLNGDMSLIGPRPLLPQYLHLYNDFQNRRHEVKPGITGWAQVNGRNAISWDKKFELDVWYVDHISFSLDFKIVLLTLKKIIKSSEVTADGHATMPRFDKLNN
ncbi:UDP-galactose phosphate transferase [Flavobacterium psychrophilum]|uniref:sugar transferase n=1 Tax=Flavobacterium psychrophilum TaxID=96345 RepID=UPI000A3D2640|nr:sugar transferase [Flavobacterium psychrophilum]EKT4544162.1 sugar transferase [Flavobacterium psychrophilum]OUD30886.1 lipid carrier--UDP-N-acetylgalactosaminyltransferase [Flavobacterium psychrophilum]ROO21798.1 UDP-galactose phosphate transferase [Flavobacterium psychrophilum]SNB38370.1 Putative undecaprenyl-phosphate sugar transferase [Flavobacterium psychrophilum]